MRSKERLIYILTILLLIAGVVFSPAPASGGVWKGTGLLATGQTTSYSSELDDGYYEAGIAKSYTAYIAEQFAGTSNIDLVHLTDTSIAFAATTPGTITDSNNGLAIFKTGDVLIVTGSVGNDGTYNISTGNVAGTIRTTEATVLGAATPSVSLAKREALSNNAVLDNNTGLMWARYTSAENAAMGAASDGKMPWTGQLYDIFAYCAAANVAELGGYSDWRIPNISELGALLNMEPADARPDATAFPSWPGGSTQYIWSSTVLPVTITYRMRVGFYRGDTAFDSNTASYYAALVRGGV